MLAIIALLGTVGFILALMGQGGWSRLGGAVAGTALFALLLVPFVSTAALFLAASVMGAILGLMPPFDRETAPRAHAGWLLGLMLATVGLFLWATVGDTEMIALILFIFGPGAITAAGRFVYFLRHHDRAASRYDGQ
ncbi:hypothetical protein [Streptomyces alboniger]|uniref:Uncharacterized protein n=1 Tax=Streptomyces alboniger TaxID=132473 RepID=A0A5J6HNN0_STRAD|nr:hypothetical protein [Streptomyces alboniger]QEV21909.1 hypothetical protein CP975_34275 [Streptomyces alboniger]